ncbi:MAG: glycosyltransferase [Candidatus Marsarchaeota archaeon]|nr:glycosyltransferase [Candidatus Marsarchaeota archaeon]
MRRILQFVPTLVPGDATGGHALMIAKSLEAMGLETKVYVEEIMNNQIGGATRFTNYARENRPDDILIYHLAAPSAIADFLSSRSETLVVVYHNITPSRFFEPWDQVAATGQIWARAQLSRLAPRTTLGLPVSKFNQEELIELGYGETRVVPILLDPSVFASGSDEKVDCALRENRSRGRTNFLFVGRLVPNKAQHNLIAALGAYNKIYSREAIFHLVGRPFSREYLMFLKEIARKLEVEENVNFTMGVSAEELSSYYRGSDAMICLSEHEGFCVPLIEAMYNDLPIVAFNSSAIAETMGGAGILIQKNDPVTTAVAMDKIVTDHELRSFVKDQMRLRLEQLSLPACRHTLFEALSGLEPSLAIYAGVE